MSLICLSRQELSFRCQLKKAPQNPECEYHSREGCMNELEHVESCSPVYL